MTNDAGALGQSRRVVLLAEDDRDIRELISLKLTGAGFTVVAVSDGAAALAAAAESVPDLALLDVMMPFRSGLEVTRALRADPRTADVPVILLTARSQEFDVESGFVLGANDYIVKPFSPRELVERVRAALASPLTLIEVSE
ncbi:MAG: response regulator receiver [Frankiales bacterium]|jgi:DNA-binding response OmpR family regulator|nr:response regulator receiver [Frankiales bacterium]